MVDLAIKRVGGLIMVNETEAPQLGLPPLPHGVILLTTEDDADWMLATHDLEFLGMALSAAPDVDLTRVVLRTGQFTSLIPGWPTTDIGTRIDLPDPDPERD